MDIDLTIGEAKDIVKIFNEKKESPQDNKIQIDQGRTVIAVLQRGHVAVGKFYQHGDISKLCFASIIRHWGTSEGLGELAKKGPLENTKLDKCTPIHFHIRELIFIMEVDDAAWGKYHTEY